MDNELREIVIPTEGREPSVTIKPTSLLNIIKIINPANPKIMLIVMESLKGLG
ncbi:hypothetical protein [Clostridium manihotivorum]|uniref:hypothetical protein n=1 Tax=Clostridium manihotivorum TaxID=2320868 RepID=UPI0013E2A5E3|nr:hypothetical protein [Clostridium manihotivorum]